MPRSALLPLLLPIVLSVSCSGSNAPPPFAAPAPAAPPPAAPFALPSAAQGSLTLIDASTPIPLEGVRVDAKPGDYLLTTDELAAVISAEGKIIDFGPKNSRDELVAVDPTLLLGLYPAHTQIQQIKPLAPHTPALHIQRRVLEKPLILHTLVYFEGRALHIETAAQAENAEGATVAITLGERISWGNVPSWAEGHGFISTGGLFPTDFVARESLGVAYALCSPQGRLHPRFGSPPLPGFYSSALTGEQTIPVPEHGLSPHRVIALSTSATSLGQAVLALPCVARSSSSSISIPSALPERARIEVARCPASASEKPRPFARFAPRDQHVSLPEGCFQARLVAPGHAPTPWLSPAELAKATLPPSGTLRFSIYEGHEGDKNPSPARILVRGIKPTPDPDWGDDPDEGAALNVIYSETGKGERPLPPGRYQVIVGRGFEYSDDEREITISPSSTYELDARLERVVDTRGFLSADLHLHAAPSPDAPQPLADRIRALVATGVEVGVATDHNKVTDYRPTIEALGQQARIASIVGDEVTADLSYFGHFNVFPLRSGQSPLEYKGVTPARIFADARRLGPLGEATLIQVNHPRMGDIGYFDLLHLDPNDMAGSLRRAPLADMGFSALEVFNGDHYAAIPLVEEVMRDWYALLDAGYRVTATGNSDSHKLTFHEAGVPRNLVAMAKDDPGAFDERAFADAVRKGRVVVSSGPFVTLEANGKGIGETVAPGAVELLVRVDAPPWVDVDRVELVRRGELIETFNGPFSDAHPRFETRVRKELHKGDWIIAIARGKKPMRALHRPGALPFAFTNPIWVD